MSSSDYGENGYRGNVDGDDYGFDCSMCGKPMSYRSCGMCVSCEQIDNDVPDIPYQNVFSSTGICPECGCELETEVLSDNHGCSEDYQYCTCCNWQSEPYVEC